MHDYDVKVPNFTFCRGREHNTTALFFFPQLDSLSELNSKISAIKFEAARIHYLSDVFVTVAVIVA